MPRRRPENASADALVGYRIGCRMAAQGLTQPEVAQALGRNQSHVSALLRGRTISIAEAWMLCRVLDVGISALLGPPTARDERFLSAYRQWRAGRGRRPLPPGVRLRGAEVADSIILAPAEGARARG